MAEGEEVHEIADRRTIFRHISVSVFSDRVWQSVAAAMRNRGKIPVLFDELQQRDMIVVGVIDISLLGTRFWRCGVLHQHQSQRHPRRAFQQPDRALVKNSRNARTKTMRSRQHGEKRCGCSTKASLQRHPPRLWKNSKGTRKPNERAAQRRAASRLVMRHLSSSGGALGVATRRRATCGGGLFGAIWGP
jgi:hypothetical protein